MTLLKTIQFDEQNEEGDYYALAYKIGEKINMLIFGALFKGMKKREIKKKEYTIEDVLQILDMISEIIQIAEQKEKYFEVVCWKSKQNFLHKGLGEIYMIISDENQTLHRISSYGESVDS